MFRFRGGVSFNKLEFSQEDASEIVIGMKPISFNGSVETWHLFDITNFFGVGFMGNGNFDLGGNSEGYVKINGVKQDVDDSDAFWFGTSFILGPAVDFTLGKVVRFNLSFGFAVGVYGATIFDSEQALSFAGAGFGSSMQAKFLPKAAVSPILGYRLVSLYGAVSTAPLSDSDDKTNFEDASLFSNQIYVGISFNW